MMHNKTHESVYDIININAISNCIIMKVMQKYCIKYIYLYDEFRHCQYCQNNN